MSSPVRVGVIGLGRGSGISGPGLWAANAHLPYLIASPKFQVVAVSNSTVQSAQASIDHHKLGSSVAAYGSAEDLAADPNVDLVVVAVRIGKHYALAKPALLAGKDVFVEWPLGATTAEAVELAQLAETKGVRTIVGVQKRASPLVVKIKELVASGKLGKVLSTSVVGSLSGPPIGIWMEGVEYYLDINSGANSLIVYFGHFLDSFIHVLGDFVQLSSTLKTAYPLTTIVNTEGKVVAENYIKTSPDHILVQGTLSSSATASLSYYTAPGPTIDNTGIRWLITGTEGEIEVTTPEGGWQIRTAGAVLKLREGKGEVQTIDWQDVKEEPVIKGLDDISGSVGRSYEAFVGGDEERGKFADFKDAVRTHELLDRIRDAAK
ncbi:hypothetical protein B0O99DRAFT_611578 [Bisporella sp. PMI_857]|nr:hypothetical protein B0O99DRAFT_611578 [Bisporella sp. PMI_857]